MPPWPHGDSDADENHSSVRWRSIAVRCPVPVAPQHACAADRSFGFAASHCTPCLTASIPPSTDRLPAPGTKRCVRHRRKDDAARLAFVGGGRRQASRQPLCALAPSRHAHVASAFRQHGGDRGCGAGSVCARRGHGPGVAPGGGATLSAADAAQRGGARLAPGRGVAAPAGHAGRAECRNNDECAAARAPGHRA